MTYSGTEQLVEQISNTKKAIEQMNNELKSLMATLDEHRANGLLDAYEGEDGTFYINKCRLLPITRGTWTYSNAVKDLQKQEQTNGIATRKETTFLRFELPK